MLDCSTGLKLLEYDLPLVLCALRYIKLKKKRENEEN